MALNGNRGSVPTYNHAKARQSLRQAEQRALLQYETAFPHRGDEANPLEATFALGLGRTCGCSAVIRELLVPVTEMQSIKELGINHEACLREIAAPRHQHGFRIAD
jgi:hypothetical protein